jgi:nucleotide-binding universal stress UspA family protein
LDDTPVPLFPVKCIVVPIDFSESSATAVATGLELVSDAAHVHVLHAVLPTSNFSPEGEWAPLRQGEVVGTVSRTELADYVERHHFDGVTQAIEFGDPATTVAAYAKEHRADLIVLTSHGYHGIKRMIMGSVAEQIIRHCECAVLVLHRSDSLSQPDPGTTTPLP